MEHARCVLRRVVARPRRYFIATAAQRETRIPEAALATATQLREQALADDTGWKIVESLTTEVGPRLAGSEADARAVAWAKAKFKAARFRQGVDRKPVTFPKWERRSEQRRGARRARAAADADRARRQPRRHGRRRGRALRRPRRAEKPRPPDRWPARSPSSTTRWNARATAAATAPAARVRSSGPSAAIRAGAVGLPDAFGRHRLASQSAHRHHALRRRPDADSVGRAGDSRCRPARAAGRARRRSRVRVALDCGWNGEATSHNVIGEITRSRASPTKSCVIGGHLDSWDLGTGAIDDGAGVGHHHGGRAS